MLALQYGGLDRGPLRSSLVRPLPLRRVQRLSGLAILEHKPISPPSVPLCLCPPPPLDTPDIAQHSRSLTTHPDTPPPPASPAPTLQSARRAAKERAPRALVADRDSHCSLSAQERTASTETRAKRGRPTPYSSSCSGSQHSCFQPLTSNFTKRPCFHHPDSNPASSARAYPPEQHDRIVAAHRRPQLSSQGARASTRVICARIVQTSSRASASTPAQTFALRKSQTPPTLKATAAGRAQRHRRVNSDTRDRTNRLPEHCRATRKTPAKSRRDGMLVVLPATIYTCNGVWYHQPSSTERFRYVLLPARIMRRRRPLRLFRRVSSYCDSC